MEKCWFCEDTGISKISKNYCTCTIGEVQKRVASAKRTANEKRVEEQKAKETKRKEFEYGDKKYVQVVEPKNKSPFDVGDWVKATAGERGYVIKNDERYRKSVVSFVFDKFGRAFNGKFEYPIDWHDIDLIPDEKPNKHDLLQMIDLALDLQDKEWFERLVAELKELEGAKV